MIYWKTLWNLSCKSSKFLVYTWGMQKLVIWQITCHNNLTKRIKQKKKKKTKIRIRGRKIAKNLLDYALDGDQRVKRRQGQGSTFFSAPESRRSSSFLRFPVPTRERTPLPFERARKKEKKKKNRRHIDSKYGWTLGRLSRPHHSPEACPTRTILICQILRSDRSMFRQSTERARAKKNSLRRDFRLSNPRRLLIFKVLFLERLVEILVFDSPSRRHCRFRLGTLGNRCEIGETTISLSK